MGKQSSRLIYQDKDHKDIYFRRQYHRAMYLGSKLLWEKLPGEKYFLYIYKYYSNSDRTYYENPRSFDTDSHLITDYTGYTKEGDSLVDGKVYRNNLYTVLEYNNPDDSYLITVNGKNFLKFNVEDFDEYNMSIADGYIGFISQTTPFYRRYVYFVETDKNANELSRTELYDESLLFGSARRVLIPHYPYFYDYFIVSRYYQSNTYRPECAIVGKHGGYFLEYVCNGNILFCYCENELNLVFTDSRLVHIFENGSIRYRVPTPSNIWACLKMKYQNKYVLYGYVSTNEHFAIYITTDFLDYEQVNKDYLVLENQVVPSIPFVLILKGSNQDEILSNYESCYYCVLSSVSDINFELTHSAMFEDEKHENFDSFFLQLSFRGKGSGTVSSTTKYVYIDNLLFEESDKNYLLY